jgi:exosortase
MNLSSPYHRFALLSLVSVFIWWHALVTTFALAFGNDAHTHILLILPISVALIYSAWTSRKLQPEPNFRAGSALLVLAALIGFIGGGWRQAGSLTAGVQLSIGILALVTWWIGAFVFCFGARTAQRFAFPLGFLLWLVPLPAVALNQIVSFLQRGSASAAHLLFTIARVPAAQDGVVLSLPGMTLEVAKECSSIRSSMMLLITGMVLAQLLLRTSCGKILVTLAVVPFSIAKNGLRVFVIAMLGLYVDPSYLHGRLHHNGGIVFFLVSLAGLFVLLWLTGRVERSLVAQPAATLRRSMPRQPPTARPTKTQRDGITRKIVNGRSSC